MLLSWRLCKRKHFRGVGVLVFFLFLNPVQSALFIPTSRQDGAQTSHHGNRNAHNAGAPLAWRDGLARLALLQPRMVSPISRAPWLRCSHADGRPPLPPSRRDRLPNRLDSLTQHRHMLSRASRALHLALPLRGRVLKAWGHTRLHRLGGGECLRDRAR